MISADGQEPVKIAVVIPCYKVVKHVMGVIEAVPAYVWRIYAVDDGCPEKSGDVIERENKDDRVIVVRNERNQGVGGAVMNGYRRAIEDGADVIVKIDGDGQMDPALVDRFVLPIRAGYADYTKGNRFYDLRYIRRMPAMRLIGNAALSFMAKVSTGYWDLFDPTNGYTAIHARVAAALPLDKISSRYFFETDMLFRLGTYRAVVVDVPMDSLYADEKSNLKIGKAFGEFLFKHSRNFAKRIFYNYFLRDLSAASIELAVGVSMLIFGATYGAYHWWASHVAQAATATGVIMLAAMPIILGLQLVLAFVAYDVASLPRRPIADRLGPARGVLARHENV
ncbi:MAG: glycosyltransferase family 2 protein [Lysobacter sp.]|nr:MAG: glycosyltransferase family 2 protein [Lysobacter sp.]